MQNRFLTNIFVCFLWLFATGLLIQPTRSQSRDVNFPTAVTTSEIVGLIKARDIGDSRLTTYYFSFSGTPGDLFINVVTSNFSGDIDVFMRDGLRPLTKMVIYGDAGVSETGRLIYLRKNERLLLRVQGRTPNDDHANFRIKFGGSFLAARSEGEVEVPTIEADPQRSGTIVNSVGTIIGIVPKPEPEAEREKKTEPQKAPEAHRAQTTKTVADNAAIPPDVPTKLPEPPKRAETTANSTPGKPVVVVESTIKDPPAAKAIVTEKKGVEKVRAASRTAATTGKAKAEEKSNPLASIRLVILLKDGTLIERRMSEIQRFSVDNGVLIVRPKSGVISRFQIVDVARVTIE